MDWIELLGGIAIFIYGLQLANDGLQKCAGDHLRRWLTALTEGRLSGLLSGTLLAAMLQSSTATVLMLMGFANADLLSLPQAMSLLLAVFGLLSPDDRAIVEASASVIVGRSCLTRRYSYSMPGLGSSSRK